MSGELKQRTVLITGAAQGLGEALALRFSREGCAVALADLKADVVAETADRVHKATGMPATSIAVDVTDPDRCQQMVAAAESKLGPIDVLIANAGILIARDILEFDPKDWRRVIDVNLQGYFNAAWAVAPGMAERKQGVILQINSKSGKKGSFRNSAYAASKFGGIGLTQSIALDLAPYGVRVNSICPGNLLDGTLWQESLFEQYAVKWGLTLEEVRKKYEDQVPLGRGCTYEDVCNVAVFLASDSANYMTGQAINVTGGQEMR